MEIPERVRDLLLRRWPVARLATQGRGATPHLVPIVFAWNAGRIWSPVDAKPKRPGEVERIRNVRRDPRVCVLLDRYGADWTELWWLRLDGIAEVRSTEDPARDAAMAAAATALREKYPQYAATPLFRESPTLLCIQVERVRSWCAGPNAIPEE